MLEIELGPRTPRHNTHRVAWWKGHGPVTILGPHVPTQPGPHMQAVVVEVKEIRPVADGQGSYLGYAGRERETAVVETPELILLDPPEGTHEAARAIERGEDEWRYWERLEAWRTSDDQTWWQPELEEEFDANYPPHKFKVESEALSSDGTELVQTIRWYATDATETRSIKVKSATKVMREDMRHADPK